MFPERTIATGDRGPAMVGWLRDARERTLRALEALPEDALLGPYLPIVNAPLWELGHVGWFQEKWLLRDGGRRPSLRADADALYDSAAVPHRLRWSLPLPSWEETLAYAGTVLDRACARLEDPSFPARDAYFVRLAVFHEDMHGEAFVYTRQTHGHAAPPLGGEAPSPAGSPPATAMASGDVPVPGGTFLLGSPPPGSPAAEPFVFDNEKWAHPVVVRPFWIARTAVTQAEFAAFVEDGGYRRPELWSEAGWRWREATRAASPVYWERRGAAWLRRDFDRWHPLEPRRPVLHVNWFEADAWCRWAGRRLPTEAEWEVAASGEPDATGRALAPRKRRYPWGDDPPTPARANLDGRAMGTLDVDALPAGDSAFGCRQMLGNVWEWCADDFGPYPGFAPDPYREYSEPWFGSHKVLRGGCWVTRGRLLRNTWRNFFPPDRRDVWAGFRTCAL